MELTKENVTIMLNDFCNISPVWLNSNKPTMDTPIFTLLFGKNKDVIVDNVDDKIIANQIVGSLKSNLSNDSDLYKKLNSDPNNMQNVIEVLASSNLMDVVASNIVRDKQTSHTIILDEPTYIRNKKEENNIDEVVTTINPIPVIDSLVVINAEEDSEKIDPTLMNLYDKYNTALGGTLLKEDAFFIRDDGITIIEFLENYNTLNYIREEDQIIDDQGTFYSRSNFINNVIIPSAKKYVDKTLLELVEYRATQYADMITNRYRNR